MGSCWGKQRCIFSAERNHAGIGAVKGYKDGLQPESLADDGNWLVKQNQPVSKIETKSDKLIQKSPRRSWAILKLRWEDQLAVLRANANKMLMRAVQQNVLLILNRVPVTFVTDPELIWPSIPVMTHSLDQKVMVRKAKARKCTAEILGNI